MLRLILIAIFLYLLVKFFKLLFRKPPEQKKPPQPDTSGTINEMVQDPVCKVYVPKNSALSIRDSGTTYYFCSKECMKKFKA